MEKLLPIINVAVSVIALIVSVVVLLQVVGLKADLAPPEEVLEEEAEAEVIPLSQLEEFNMDGQFILTPTDALDPEITYNVVFKMGFAIDPKNEGAADTKKVLTGQGSIIREEIYLILNSKDASYFKVTEKVDELKNEILLKVHELLGNDAIARIYFIDPIVKEN